MLLNNLSWRPEGSKERADNEYAFVALSTKIALLLMGMALLPAINAQQAPKADATIARPAFEVAAIKVDKGDSGNHNV